MQLSHQYLQNFYHLLQTCDTSLGIDLQGNQVTFVQIRKQLNGFKILKEVAISREENNADISLFEVIKEEISRHNLNSKFTNIVIPFTHCLVKNFTIPRIPSPEILAFLLQNPELYLPANLDIQEFSLYYKILSSEDPQNMNVLVILQRKLEKEQVFPEAGSLDELYSVHYRGLNCENVFLPFNPDFNGIILDIDSQEKTAFIYDKGQLKHLTKSEIEINSLLSDSSDFTTNENAMTLIPDSTSQNTEIPFESRFENYHKANHLPTPEYLGAFSASLTPFFQDPGQMDLLSSENKNSVEKYFYKQVSLKSVLFAGIILLLLFALSFTINTGLEWYHGNQLTSYIKLKPVLTKNDALKTEQISLQKFWNDYNLLKQEKTYLAYYLLRIAENIPEKIWIESSEITTQEAEGTEIKISGFSLSEQEVTLLLNRLEKLPFCRTINLDRMVVYKRDEIYRKWKLRYNKLFEFQVHFYV